LLAIGNQAMRCGVQTLSYGWIVFMLVAW